MGCDIHSHIEIKLNGKWEHWTAPKIDRNYSLFGRLAGVRGGEAMYPVRGLPSDCTAPTLWDYDLTFGHTASWINHEELNETQLWLERDMPPGHGWHTVIGYLASNGYHTTDDVSEIRMVFWFDN